MGAIYEVAGLYAVTPDENDTERLAKRVRDALAGGARLVQYRNKTADTALRLEQARMLLAICRRRNVPLIVNDHLDLALAIDADGLHLGSEDAPFEAARRQFGPHKLLGVSCYDKLQYALDAERNGADYVAFGSFFTSSVKPGAVRAPLELLSAARQTLSVPVVAIGGITLETAPSLIAAGADAIAVISALFAVSDVKLAARQFGLLFNNS